MAIFINRSPLILCMHIEARTIGRNVKYYLACSYRRNGKVKKARVYLGSNLSESELSERKKSAEAKINEKMASINSIRDPFHTVLSSSEARELQSLEAKGAIRVLHLTEDDWLKFSEAFTFNTNAIEGSKVTLQEVKSILEDGEWPKDKSKEDISETYGVAEAIKYTRETREHFSLELTKKLHAIVFKNSKPFAGKFRSKGVEVVVADGFGNIVHRGAPSTEIASLLKKLVEWYGENKKKYSPLVLAAVVHNQFENIHPFQDGNGRVGRLLMNNILLKRSKPPINIQLKNRTAYYYALQEYQRNGNLRPTIELMLKEYKSLKTLLKRKR